jgi:predicted ATP-grasp superfamily ATP-dependent carboligase
MEKVLILDANQRSALAATRSLGRRGIPVAVADERDETLAGFSKYCREKMTYPSPSSQPGAFVETLRREAFKRGVKIIFPMTEITTHLLLKNRDAFSGIQIPFAPFETFERLSNKWELYQLANQLGLRAPKTHYVKSQDDLDAAIQDLKFPIVIKPYRSRLLLNGEWLNAAVRYASSIQEIHRVLATSGEFRDHPFLLQEYIEGRGQGIFALYDLGKPILFFAHKRLREKPPSGGVSVLCESVKVDPLLQEIGQKILDHVAWHGVAMVEFKVSPSGLPYLIEINARFWGSLQLAIDAGVDFPWLLYRMALGIKIEEVKDYKVGVRSRWLLGDLDHLYLKFKGGDNQPLALSQKCGAFLRFLNFFETNTRHEVNRWEDLRPFLFELREYFKLQN